LGRIGVGRDRGIEADGPPARGDFVRLDGMILESKKLDWVGNLFSLVCQMAIEMLLPEGSLGIVIVVARNGEPRELDLLEKPTGFVEFFREGCCGKVASQKDEVDP
jgi:hypothetical protein